MSEEWEPKPTSKAVAFDKLELHASQPQPLDIKHARVYHGCPPENATWKQVKWWMFKQRLLGRSTKKRRETKG